MAKRTFVVAAACALTASVALGTPAALADAPAGGPGDDGASVVLPTMSWITTGVRLASAAPEKAWVSGRYRCSAEGANTTMWVSARQAPGVGSPDLSPESLAWYDAELRSFVDDAGFAATCDSRWHDGRVAVERQFGALQKGPALVEWCLHDKDEKPVNSPGFTTSCTLESVPAR